MTSLTDTLRDIAQLNPETIFLDRSVRPERPFVDPDVEVFEGFDDAELAAHLELDAAKLDKAGLYGIALDLRGAAVRIRKLSGETK